jgi:hypothetical protein
MKGSDKETTFPEASHRSGLPAEMNCTLYSFRIFVSADPVRHGIAAPECKESRNGRQWK